MTFTGRTYEYPVEGWYRTTWRSEEQAVQEVCRLEALAEGTPVAVRVTANPMAEDGTFVNGEWLTLHLGGRGP